MSDTKTDPTKFLGSIIGSAVVVKLHNGVEYQGDLQSIDGYMNVVLQSAKEFVQEKVTKSYGDVFIRGNNGMFLLFLSLQMLKGSFKFLQTS
ncbi:U6 snRNA-associated protein LSM6 [Metschnikowia aff. pulcherrima]|uniref:U6 snRNA-associated protein LSM6 n=1 Tax=Metschnikowia aff. pulcherrima TaxID=2163413 RepID=A0A4P6XR72_9ASCO|nr:U6 snRNA-associated protein LSM6 [Metschnikowia aff. pulcherrima]